MVGTAVRPCGAGTVPRCASTGQKGQPRAGILPITPGLCWAQAHTILVQPVTDRWRQQLAAPFVCFWGDLRAGGWGQEARRQSEALLAQVPTVITRLEREHPRQKHTEFPTTFLTPSMPNEPQFPQGQGRGGEGRRLQQVLSPIPACETSQMVGACLTENLENLSRAPTKRTKGWLVPAASPEKSLTGLGCHLQGLHQATIGRPMRYLKSA